jgi:hypothetical protein
MGWFSDADKQGAFYTKFIAADFIAMSHPAAAAQKIWAGTCNAMRLVMDKNAAAGIRPSL